MEGRTAIVIAHRLSTVRSAGPHFGVRPRRDRRGGHACHLAKREGRHLRGLSNASCCSSTASTRRSRGARQAVARVKRKRNPGQPSPRARAATRVALRFTRATILCPWRFLKLARGPACCAGPLVCSSVSRPVSRVLYGAPLAPAIRDGHSSGTRLHGASSNLPERRAGHPHGVPCANPPLPFLFGLAPGVVCHAARCRQRGALLPHLFTLTCDAEAKRFRSLWHFP